MRSPYDCASISHCRQVRDLIAGAGKQRLDQFEVAHRDGVEHQAVLPLVIADAVHVLERTALRRADVV